MDAIEEQELVKEVRNYVTENLPLSKMSDEDLEDKVEEIVTEKLRNRYCPVEQKVSIVKQVYSSIRGFGLLDSIISDDSITEVMINGADNIFIEKNGKLQKAAGGYHSENRRSGRTRSKSGKSDCRYQTAGRFACECGSASYCSMRTDDDDS